MNIILNNANLVTMASDPQGYQIKKKQIIVICDGKIAEVGPQINSSYKDLPVFNCENKLLTPGLIDCHTHLIFAGDRSDEFEMRLTGISYTEINKKGGGILSTVKATRKASKDELIALALPRLDGLIQTGITSVEIKSGYGLNLNDEIKILQAAKSLENERKVKIVTTLLAAHAVPLEYKNNPDNYIDLICQEIIPQVAEENLATSVDVFCENIGFNLKQTEKIFKTAKKYKLQIKGHVEQLSILGGSTLVSRYQGLSVDHIEYLNEQGVIALANSGTVATLLPGAFYFLKETKKPPVDLLRKHRVPIAIATDFNPGTSPFADIGLMMNMSCTLFGLTPEEALRGVTSNAAKALGYNNSRGQISKGYDADLCLWNISNPADLSYQTGLKRLHKRFVNGEICDD